MKPTRFQSAVIALRRIIRKYGMTAVDDALLHCMIYPERKRRRKKKEKA